MNNTLVKNRKVEIKDLELIEKHLTPYLSFLRDKKLFITGGTGFFGKWILEAIIYLNKKVNLNLKVLVLSRTPDKFKINYPHLCRDTKIEFIKGDIQELDIPLFDVDYIIHAATDVSSIIERKNSELTRKTILNGSKKITDYANKVDCKRVLYTSSGAAYGTLPIDMQGITEDFNSSAFDPKDTYGSAKLESELFFKNNLNCELVIARCFAFSGPYLPLDGSFAFGNFINNIIKNENIKMNSDGQCLRSYLYGADLVIWLFTLLIKGQNKEVYNVGSNEYISVFELAKKIYSYSNNQLFINKDIKNNSIYYPNINKCNQAFGLKVFTSIDMSIVKTVNFYL